MGFNLFIKSWTVAVRSIYIYQCASWNPHESNIQNDIVSFRIQMFIINCKLNTVSNKYGYPSLNLKTWLLILPHPPPPPPPHSDLKVFSCVLSKWMSCRHATLTLSDLSLLRRSILLALFANPLKFLESTVNCRYLDCDQNRKATR